MHALLGHLRLLLEAQESLFKRGGGTKETQMDSRCFNDSS